jgi:hypothetical protein
MLVFPVTQGGIDLDFPLDKLLAQTVGNLERGFRAIKMKVGRPRLPKTSHGSGLCANTSESIFR